jgi:hypothetical protein
MFHILILYNQNVMVRKPCMDACGEGCWEFDENPNVPLASSAHKS